MRSVTLSKWTCRGTSLGAGCKWSWHLAPFSVNLSGSELDNLAPAYLRIQSIWGCMRYTECKTVQRHWFQFKNKMKNGKKLRQGRKEVGVFRWSMKTGGKYVTKPTTSIFLRGSFIPKLFHLQKNLWIKIYVKLWQLFVLIQRFMLFFLSGEEREVMRSSRYCLESKRRIAVNDRGLLICFHALNI